MLDQVFPAEDEVVALVVLVVVVLVVVLVAAEAVGTALPTGLQPSEPARYFCGV